MIWVMGWGANAKVLEPESLKQAMKAEINSLFKLYN